MSDVLPIQFPAADGYPLYGTYFPADDPHAAPLILINSATAVPQGYYHYFAVFMRAQGFSIVTFDYRGIGASAPGTLKGFEAHVSDWGLKDIQGAVDHIENTYAPKKFFLVGHSAGGQQAGLITRPERVDAMLTLSAQSGYWGLQGGWEKPKIWLLAYFLMPLLTRVFGYFPWKRLGGEDLPYHVALEWAAWCRSPGYLRDDKSLPLERFDAFTAPVLAYSVDDDDWGTKAAVRSMMSAYPNASFEHLIPKDHGIEHLGHLGYFRPKAEALWHIAARWFLTQAN